MRPPIALLLSCLLHAFTTHADELPASTTVAMAMTTADPMPAELVERAAPDVIEDPRITAAREVALAMSEHRAALQSCYERQLHVDPTLSGTVEVQFTVRADGTIRKARLGRDEVHNKALNRCLVSRLEGARLPAPSGGALRFAYPLHFHPVN